MTKLSKILGLCFLSIFLCFYIVFLFVLPNAVDLNKYKTDIVKLVQQQSKLNIDFSNAKLVTTPFLATGIQINDIKVTLPDNSLLFSANSVKTTLSLPSILLFTVKISDFDIEKPFLNLEIVENNHFKIVKLIENIINENKQQQIGKIKNEKKPTSFDMSFIRIKVPKIKLTEYTILIKDLKTNHYLNLNGKELVLGYFNGKRAKIKGDAHLFVDTKENITAKIDINTFLPPAVQTSDAEDDEAIRVDFPFVNPVELYRKYDLKTVINAKLRINNRKNKMTAFGYLNIDDLTLLVDDIKLPESYLHAETKGQRVNLDTIINVTPNAQINVLGKLFYGKNLKTDIIIKTGKIYFQDLIDFSKALMNSLGIKNDIEKYSAKGYINADAYIKTNFKKLKSNGSIICKDGELTIKNEGKVISSANINVLLNDNILNIDKSSLYLGNAKVSLDGSIDNSSNADISVNTDTVNLPFLFNAFAPKELKAQYSLKSGDIKLNIYIKGKLKEAVSNIEIWIKNLIFADKTNSFIVKNSNLEAKLLAGAKVVSAGVINQDFNFTMPKTKSNVYIPKVEINFAENNININENKIVLNNNSQFTYKGSIIDLQKPKDIKFIFNGNLDTTDIIQLLGKENERYFNKKGSVPINVSFIGNNIKQTLFIECLADKNNFITPLEFDLLKDKSTVLQTIIDFKTGRFKIKNTGLYAKEITTDENGKEKTNLEEIIGLSGTVAKDTINVIQINIPNHMQGIISLFPNSIFTLEKSRLLIYGKTIMPRIKGSLNLLNVSIPEILLKLNKFNLKFEGQKAEIKLDNLDLNNSVSNISTAFKFIQNGIFKIDSLKINSNRLDVDRMMKISDCTEKYFPSEKENKNTSKSDNEILVELKDGKIGIGELKTGKIVANNISSDMYLKKNVLSLKNLNTNIFNGNVNGDIFVNLINSGIAVNVTGNNINVKKAMEDAAGVKDALNGTTDFAVDLSLRGSNYEEQMKNLSGNISFIATDGQFGPFAKLENLIIAENIRNSEFFQSALGGIIQKLTTIDTTHYDKFAGKISFKNGICKIEEMTSSGSVLMMHIFGEFDLLQNTVDMRIRAKMTSLIAEMLGPISAINPIKLINTAASTNIVTAKAFSLFCETLEEDEINKIPSFSDKYVETTSNANRFQLVAKGDVAKPLTLIKSFKWITTQVDFQKASDFIASLPNPVEGSTATTIEEVIEENEKLEKEKKTVIYKVKHLLKKEKTIKKAG